MKLNRLQLYALSWAMPQSDLAKWVNRSTTLIYLAARKFNVPKPPNGHWGKVRSGKPVVRPTLPDPQDLRETSLSIDDRFENDVNLLSMQALTLPSAVQLQCPESMRSVEGFQLEVSMPESMHAADEPSLHVPATPTQEGVARGGGQEQTRTAGVGSCGPAEALDAPSDSRRSMWPPPGRENCSCATSEGSQASTSHDRAISIAGTQELRLLEYSAAFAQWEVHLRFLAALEARAQCLSSPARERLMIEVLRARLTLACQDPVAQVVAQVA